MRGMAAAVVVFLLFGVVMFWLSNLPHNHARTQQLARALGLTVATGPNRPTKSPLHQAHELFGVVGGVGVYVGQRSHKHGVGTSHFTYVDVVFDAPLKRGLAVWHVDDDRFLVHHDLPATPTGTRLDWKYKVYGEPRLVAPIVTAPAVESLLAVDRGRFTTFVCDRFVRIECPDETEDPGLIGPQIVDAVALAQAIRAAVDAAPSALEMEVAPVWQPICERAGLTYDRRAIRGAGQLGALGVRVEAVLDESGRWKTEIEASISPPLAIHLRIEAQGVMNVLFGRDVHLGEPAFDEAFLVECQDARNLREILTPAACASLLALRPHQNLQVTDDGVRFWVPGVVTDAAVLASLTENVIGAAAAMIAHRPVAPVGPYR